MTSLAVILAAGVGRRLSNISTQIPKGFIRFGDKPIIEESIDKLLSLNIEKILIVTGHLSHFYDGLTKTYKCIQTIKNPQYYRSGTLFSLFCAKKNIERDFILLESDLIYESRAIEEIVNHPWQDVILVSGFTGMGGEVLVEAKDNFLINMSKDKSNLRNIIGEFVGISKISMDSFQEMFRLTEKKISSTLHLNYETGGFVILSKERSIFCHKVENLVWCEIDNEHHYNEAMNRVYPLLKDRQTLVKSDS